jgi:AcrR family transcriptional regulator
MPSDRCYVGRVSGADTREQIVAVSARLFDQHGITGTTMRAIAEGCSIRAASLYNHFASKDEIVAEVMTRSNALAIALFDEIRTAELTPLARLDALLRATMRSFLAHPEASRLFFENVDHVVTAPLLDQVRADVRAIRRLWLQALGDGVKARVVRDDLEPERLWPLLRNMMLAASRELDRAPARDVTDDVARILLQGIVRPERLGSREQ